jgi:hypothetical protein
MDFSKECGRHPDPRPPVSAGRGRWTVTLTMRKWLIVAVSAFILLLAGAYTIVAWLDELGLVRWAQAVRDEYLPGSTITIIVALLVLVGSPAAYRLVHRCPVCNHLLWRGGPYCPACGSRT